MDKKNNERRSHPRVYGPKGMFVAWRAGTQQGVSRMGTMAMGGLFLHTTDPPAAGSTLELLFDIATGAEVRARAVVRNSRPGKGMGVKFVHMRSEDRSRLNQFLKAQMEAGNIQPESPAGNGNGAGTGAEKKQADVTAAAPGPAGSGISAEQRAAIAADRAKRATAEKGPVGPVTEKPAESPGGSTTGSSAGRSAEESGGQLEAEATVAQQGEAEQTGGQPTKTPARDADSASEAELLQYLTLSEKSNYYQLLGVGVDASKVEIRDGFYLLARKFHPDRHMDKHEWAAPLQKLMGAITEAYGVLSDEKKRGNYDRKQTLSRTRTETEESLDECAKLAANCHRDDNFEGAIFWLRKCVNLAPDVAKYHASLAASLATQTHHRREAVQHFEKAIELDPWNAGPFLKFAELHEAMHLPWRAEPLYHKALEIDPESFLAKQGLARIRLAEKKNKVAKPSKVSKMAGIFSKK
jgi:tetratricopeptide (TPR) repeat protein